MPFVVDACEVAPGASSVSASEICGRACYEPCMTRDELALERAGGWPEAAQVKLIRAALDIEREHAGLYRLDEDERADLQEALAEFDRGETASEQDVKAVFEQLRCK
jgi:hypothetical protein